MQHGVGAFWSKYMGVCGTIPVILSGHVALFSVPVFQPPTHQCRPPRQGRPLFLPMQRTRPRAVLLDELVVDRGSAVGGFGLSRPGERQVVGPGIPTQTTR